MAGSWWWLAGSTYSVVGCWLLVDVCGGHWVIGFWTLVAGGWWWAVGAWLLVAGSWTVGPLDRWTVGSWAVGSLVGGGW